MFAISFLGVCNVKLSEHSGVIKTPNFPNKYPRLTKCLWSIDFGKGMDVVIKFVDFNVEKIPKCEYDYATITAGVNNTNDEPKYCGFNLPPETKVTGPVSVGFVSDDDTEFQGFIAEYETIGK